MKKFVLLLLMPAGLTAMEIPKPQPGLGTMPSDIKRIILAHIVSGKEANESVAALYSYLGANQSFLNLLDLPTFKAIIAFLGNKIFDGDYKAAFSMLKNYTAPQESPLQMVRKKIRELSSQWEKEYNDYRNAINQNDAQRIKHYILAGMPFRRELLDSIQFKPTLKNTVIQLIKDKAIDPNSDVGSGETLAAWAYPRYPYLAKLLIEAGADVSRVNLGKMPLFSSNIDVSLITMLIQRGVDINQRNLAQSGTTALMNMARLNSEEAVNLLLSKGANPNLQDSKGWTALILAVRNGLSPNSLAIVKLLLLAGANPNIVAVDSRSGQRSTALDWAEFNIQAFPTVDQQELIDLLMKAGAKRASELPQ